MRKSPLRYREAVRTGLAPVGNHFFPMRAGLLKRWEAVRTSFWFIPGLMALGAVALSFAAVAVDEAGRRSWLYPGTYLIPYEPEGARSLLSTIAGSMITFAGVTFSITIAAVAYAASQFGPRILSNFLADKGNQITLGTFIATFIYCVLVLRAVHAAGTPFVPNVAIFGSLFLTIASLGVLIYFIHHIPQSIHVTTMLAHMGRELNERIAILFPERIGHGPDPEGEESPGEVPGEAAPIWVKDTGYVQFVDGDALLNLARQHDLVVRLEYQPGDFVYEGKALLYAWPADRADGGVIDELRRTFALGSNRTQKQDPMFTVNQFVEIAVRALSPGVNDPFTATTCLNWLGSALARLAGRRMPDAHRYDDDGRLRVIARPIGFEQFADAVFGQLRPDAQRNRIAALHMMAVMAAVADELRTEAQRRALRRHAAALRDGAKAALPEETDAEAVEQAYRQVMRRLQEPDTPLEPEADRLSA